MEERMKTGEMPEEDVKTADAEAEETVKEEKTAEENTKEVPEEAAENTSESEKDGSTGKKSFFKKKEKKKDPRDEKIEELTDRLKRLMAEFENFRKRTEKEKSGMYDLGSSSVLLKLLPVVDNFERGLTSIPEAERENAVYTGMDMIYKQLYKTLQDLGVEAMEAEGKPFDPNLHNAVMQAADENYPDNAVVMELQKGYTFKGNVLRHAMVSVNQNPGAPEKKEAPAEEETSENIE